MFLFSLTGAVELAVVAAAALGAVVASLHVVEVVSSLDKGDLLLLLLVSNQVSCVSILLGQLLLHHISCTVDLLLRSRGHVLLLSLRKLPI